MQTAIGFVEYLVTGCLAILWVRLAIPKDVLNALTLSGPVDVIALAWIYVLGMLIDFVSLRTIGRFKYASRKEPQEQPPAVRFLASHKNGLLEESAALVYLSKELGAEYQAKSTRDRIARGAVVNFLLVAVFAVFRMPWPTGLFVCGWAMAAAALSFATWRRFQSLSHRHRKESLATILWIQDKESIEKLAQSARAFVSAREG